MRCRLANCHTRAALLQIVAATKKQIVSGQHIAQRNRGTTLVGGQRKQIVIRALPYYKVWLPQKKFSVDNVFHDEIVGQL